MPGRNNNGPMGQGPMTGRGLGTCNNGEVTTTRPGRGLGMGRGNRRNQVYRTDSTETLEDEVARLKSRLEEIEKK